MTFKEAVTGVTSAHVKMAIKEIDKHGIPKNRRSTKWCLRIGDRRYPPKYVLSLATKYATGRALAPDAHDGGAATNDVLSRLGCKIRLCSDGSNVAEN
jgi:hypothetical protein